MICCQVLITLFRKQAKRPYQFTVKHIDHIVKFLLEFSKENSQKNSDRISRNRVIHTYIGKINTFTLKKGRLTANFHLFTVCCSPLS